MLVRQLDKDLAMIAALRELGAELRAHKEVHFLVFYLFSTLFLQKLHAEVIEELHRHLYIKFTPKKDDSTKKGTSIIIL